MNENDVGSYYTQTGADLWRLIVYFYFPSAMLENVETKERIAGAVDSSMLETFVKLIPEEKLKTDA